MTTKADYLEIFQDTDLTPENLAELVNKRIRNKIEEAIYHETGAIAEITEKEAEEILEEIAELLDDETPRDTRD